LQYQEEIAALQVQLASEKGCSSNRGHLELQNASLKKENTYLAQENSTLFVKVILEKQQIQNKCRGLFLFFLLGCE
jgi:hypothetical protein